MDDDLLRAIEEVAGFSTETSAPGGGIDDTELNDLLASLGAEVAQPVALEREDSVHLQSWGDSVIGGAKQFGASLDSVDHLLKDLDLGLGPDAFGTESVRIDIGGSVVVDDCTDLVSGSISAHLPDVRPGRGTTRAELEAVTREIEAVQDMTPIQEVPDIVVPYSALHVGEKLGLGNFGNSFAGIYGDKHVKIKRLHMQEPRKELRELLHEDAETISMMEPHPRLAPLYAVCTDEVFCTVQQYTAGTPLWGYIRNPANRGIDSLKFQLRLAKEIAEGLHHLHNSGILHLALRTKNVFVDRDQHIVINDYGFEAVKEQIIMSDMPLQDARFIAPELFLGEQAGPPADVFSFAFVLWGMFSGHTAFAGYSNEEVKSMILSNMRPELPHCPQRIGKLIQACWNADPAARPPLRTVLAILSYPMEQIIKGDPIYELTGGVGI